MDIKIKFWFKNVEIVEPRFIQTKKATNNP